ncbi:MAG: hypothetical protein AMJ56_10085 [Anaerolineae bacterium SG8_19]|nr:MAG: hypothetical protein AMJ56_10085 [Anaerolineae bacterium SG8_19]
MLVVANYVDRARGIVIPAILNHGSANFVTFAIQYPQPYVHPFWELAALISAKLLPRPLISVGKSSELIEQPKAQHSAIVRIFTTLKRRFTQSVDTK